MISPYKINVLIACEESQAETMAFRERGFRAFSCDLQPAKKGTPTEFHITGDVRKLFKEKFLFKTDDGVYNYVDHWDLIIAHPPCTYLSKVGSLHMWINGKFNIGRYSKMCAARNFFYTCLNAPAKYIAVENPLPQRRAKLPSPSFYIQPSWFGVKYTKKTLFWTKNLPPILAEIEHPNPKEFCKASRGKYRSRTFPKVAAALARQWGNYILDEISKAEKLF